MGAFYPGTELIPIPLPAALFIFNAKCMFAKNSPEPVPESTGFFINNIWQQEPEKYHHDKPQQGTY